MLTWDLISDEKIKKDYDDSSIKRSLNSKLHINASYKGRVKLMQAKTGWFFGYKPFYLIMEFHEFMREKNVIKFDRDVKRTDLYYLNNGNVVYFSTWSDTHAKKDIKYNLEKILNDMKISRNELRESITRTFHKITPEEQEGLVKLLELLELRFSGPD